MNAYKEKWKKKNGNLQFLLTTDLKLKNKIALLYQN